MEEAMNKLWFGLDINPAANGLDDIFKRAEMADSLGFDLVTSQDHPYNRQFLDTWTLLAVIGARTKHVRLGTNVVNLPLRPPAILAKQANSLSLLAEREILLGIGAGAFWRGVEAMGGKERSSKEAYEAFKEALEIIRGLWGSLGRGFSYEGEHYQLKGASFGPAPFTPSQLWTGALGPKMLHLTGQMADGIWISLPYVPPTKLPDFTARIDGGAAEAGRSPDAIRRGYNLMGALVPDMADGQLSEKGIFGNSAYWIETLSRLHEDYRQDTFNFWPAGAAPYEQIERFANEVMPALRERFG
jgi:alkanesulfonate monooxygenase SsuD/methylene tetrahydromethanopterin reductase-like flavin-dependent oxidoreductase (luciferase family)